MTYEVCIATDAPELRRKCASRLLALAPVLLLMACAAPPPGHMPVGAATSQPIGAMWFCAENAAECAPQRSAVAEIALTPERWRELRAVQHDVNRQIAPAAEGGPAWHYPVGGGGDCVQFALEKRRQLIARGWPAGALRLATVITPRTEGHLVLVAVTDEGDWVLDNLRADVARWEDLPYRWIARQRGASMADWVAIAAHG
jgi:predicted transglutaminase-like cysteine proteinase